MKINFNADFKQVSALLRAKDGAENAPAEATDFGKLLSDLSPLSAQNSINSDSSAIGKVSGDALGGTAGSDAMARLGVESSKLRPPPLTPFDMPLEPAPQVKEAEPSVKAPTLLEVRRVDRFVGLSHPEKAEAVNKLVTQYGKEFGVDPALAMAVASVESSFNPVAVSSDGHASKGLFQLLDRTGKELHERSGLEPKYDPFDPEQNTQLGMQYLRRLHDLFSSSTKLPNDTESTVAANSSSLEKLAVAAFNAGEGRVASAQARAKGAGADAGSYSAIEGYLPKSTQEYVSRVMQAKLNFEGGSETEF